MISDFNTQELKKARSWTDTFELDFTWDNYRSLIWIADPGEEDNIDLEDEDAVEEFRRTLPASLVEQYMYYIPGFPLDEYLFDDDLEYWEKEVNEYRMKEGEASAEDILNLLILGKIKRDDAVSNISNIEGMSEEEVDELLKSNNL